MTDRHLCIHGHFYQPPREDPWLGAVFPEGSAAPGRDWNTRITRESYAPLARARLLDGEGNIRELVNAYEYMSFNFGPTLLSWLAQAEPSTYELVLEADRASRRRLGFGNAMAQIRHHTIMPLANADEKRIETAWAVQDFETRYGRLPDGLWLPEAAADTATLEALAEAGIAYTVLAPRQAAAVADPGGQWTPVDEGGLDIMRPYRAELPSGRSIAIFFYHGGLSQAVAFERLLTDGGAFWNRLRGAAKPGLLSLATDGETYGHHFKFGEMALAWCLDQARNDGTVALTNFAAFLAANPPTRLVRLHEPSSWSCIHGVERWRSDCGCKNGDHPQWNQRWRAPLREALAQLKTGLDGHYAAAAPAVLSDPDGALMAYGLVLAGGQDRDSFAARWFPAGQDAEGRRTAWGLLAMQRHAHAAFASCAWFFDDLDRIEPINALANALRACELARQTGAAQDLETALEHALTIARSNPCPRHPGGRSGDALLREEAEPRRGTPESLILHALLLAWANGRDPLAEGGVTQIWPSVTVTVHLAAPPQGGDPQGSAHIAYATGEGDGRHAVEWTPPPAGEPWSSRLRLDQGQWFTAGSLPWNKRQDIALAWAAANTAAAWRALTAEAATARGLMLPLSESQNAQNDSENWERLLPALALAWVLDGGDSDADDALETMLAAAQWHPEARLLYSRAMNAHAANLLTGCEPAWDELERLAVRAESIHASVDWWPTQNRIWRLGADSPEARRAARRLGFGGAFAAP